MQFYTLQQASTSSADLGNLIASAVRDNEEAAIVSESGVHLRSVVLIPQDEFNAMRCARRFVC